ncbi:hypothetical protein LPJ53_002580 [Coemansia erecta]|uniref:RRM domain-containing protein n=1 Tax=Coemansia erecta TaxID=147472 RepID=A0A9W8CRQ1_9FUNG|nr:hypothetical protein LPJ53_002580 [Coemansia erecta]
MNAAARVAKVVVVKFSTEGVSTMDQSLKLLSHVQKFGEVTSFWVPRDPLTQQRTGMAFVTYQHTSDAISAASTTHQIVPGLQLPFNRIEVTPRR